MSGSPFETAFSVAVNDWNDGLLVGSMIPQNSILAEYNSPEFWNIEFSKIEVVVTQILPLAGEELTTTAKSQVNIFHVNFQRRRNQER